MNNKIKRKLIKEFNKNNLDTTILDNYNFDIKNKKIVYMKNNMEVDFIEIGDNRGVKLKRNAERKFRLHFIDNFENMKGGFKNRFVEEFINDAEKSQNLIKGDNEQQKKDIFLKYLKYVEENIIEKIFKNPEFFTDAKSNVGIELKE